MKPEDPLNERQSGNKIKRKGVRKGGREERSEEGREEGRKETKISIMCPQHMCPIHTHPHLQSRVHAHTQR